MGLRGRRKEEGLGEVIVLVDGSGGAGLGKRKMQSWGLERNA